MRLFSSDHHFYHQNVIAYCNRPFKDVDHMNQIMVERWNEVVQPEDEVWYLGDFSLARRAVEVFLPRLNGVKHLIAGNHDHVHPAHAKKPGREATMRAFYLAHGFASVALQERLTLGGREVDLCHLPYASDQADQRHLKWRPKDEGRWLLCGHIHEKWLMNSRMLNVGVDVHNFYPISEQRVLELISPWW